MSNRNISIIWGTDDVKHQARESDILLTDDQAWEILQYMERRHDANIGINWEVMDVFIDEWVAENGENND